MVSGPSSDIEEFGRVLQSSKRVLALCGLDLSAASGLDTFRGDINFRGDEGMRRVKIDPRSVATREAFEADPGLVWLFYAFRRQKALRAQPNAGHYALAELAKKMPGFIALTENVDSKTLACSQLAFYSVVPGRSCDASSHSSLSNFHSQFMIAFLSCLRKANAIDRPLTTRESPAGTTETPTWKSLRYLVLQLHLRRKKQRPFRSPRYYH